MNQHPKQIQKLCYQNSEGKTISTPVDMSSTPFFMKLASSLLQEGRNVNIVCCLTLGIEVTTCLHTDN